MAKYSWILFLQILRNQKTHLKIIKFLANKVSEQIEKWLLN